MLRGLGCSCTPFLGSHIGYALRKRPAVATRVLDRILPLPERFVGGWFQNSSPDFFCVLEVPVNIFNVYIHVLVNLVRTRSAERTALAAQHNSALSDRELCVADPAIPSNIAEPLGKPKGPAEPADDLIHILVDQHRHDRRSGRRA